MTSGLLPTAQNAFRRGKSCDEHIYCISQVAQGRQRMRLPTYALHYIYITFRVRYL
jgi:hypothetical protein